MIINNQNISKVNNVKILNTQILSDNWYTLKKVTFNMSLPDGTTLQMEREAYDRGNGAAILLYNTASRSVILTRQFRLPTYINGNPDGYLIEACAGLLDKDDAENCIIRETEEETGFKVSHVEKVFEAYMSPGSVTELLYFFIAEYSKEMKVTEGGGLAEENENIEVLELPFGTAIQMVRSGQIRDGKTIILLQHMALNKQWI